MRLFVIAATLAVLCACGAETATTAATSTTIKKREIEEGKKTVERTQDKIGEAMEQAQQRAKHEADK